TAALRSILAVPLPSSLTQLFEGRGAAGSGVGAGFIVKAAIAIVAGAGANRVGSDSGANRAGASAGPQARPGRAPQIAAKGPAARPARVGKKSSRTTGRAPARSGPRTSTPTVEAQLAPAVSHQSSAASAPAASGPVPATQSVANTAANTTNTVVGA